MPSRFRFRASLPTAEDRLSVLNATTDAGVATLRIYDPIDSWGGDWGVSAKEFAAALDVLPRDTTQIRLHINSPGGEVFEAVTILNQLRQHRATVTAVVEGIAASAASFIAAGADELVMCKNATLMIHDAWGLCVGNASDMASTGALLDKLSNNIAAVYADKAGGTVEDWRQAMLAESWYTAADAVDAGLADSVMDTSAEPPKANFDLSIYARNQVVAGFPERRRAHARALKAMHGLA